MKMSLLSETPLRTENLHNQSKILALSALKANKKVKI